MIHEIATCIYEYTYLALFIETRPLYRVSNRFPIIDVPMSTMAFEYAPNGITCEPLSMRVQVEFGMLEVLSDKLCLSKTLPPTRSKVRRC